MSNRTVSFRELTVATVSCLLLFFCFICLFGCGEKDAWAEVEEIVNGEVTYGVDQFVLDKLEENRIVMMADCGHGYRLYLQSVISVLDHWLKVNTEAEGNVAQVCPSLILVLERDSVKLRETLEWSENGGPWWDDYCASMYSPHRTTASIEFHKDIVCIRNAVEEYNERCAMDKRLDFHVFGPEMPIDPDQWSVEQGRQFFLHERDEYSSQKVIDLLERCPESKALIFYGSAHLEKGLVTKPACPLEAEGYYLAHYLTERFAADGGVYTMVQTPVDRGPWALRTHQGHPEVDFMVERQTLDRLADCGNLPESKVDALAVLYGDSALGMSVSHVFTASSVQCTIDRLPGIVDTANDFRTLNRRSSEWYLSVISGRMPDSVSLNDPAMIDLAVAKWQAWYESSDLNLMADIENLAIWSRLIDNLAAAPVDAEEYCRNLLLRTFQIEKPWEWRDTIPAPSAQAAFFREYLRQNERQLVIEQLVGLLWIGTPEEQKQAAELLVDMTGENYETPKEWMNWWYKSLTKGELRRVEVDPDLLEGHI